MPYHHAIWHLFVVAGSALHFTSLLYLLPPETLRI
jgi:hemolysin III